jgi:hypothetical protein
MVPPTAAVDEAAIDEFAGSLEHDGIAGRVDRAVIVDEPVTEIDALIPVPTAIAGRGDLPVVHDRRGTAENRLAGTLVVDGAGSAHRQWREVTRRAERNTVIDCRVDGRHSTPPHGVAMASRPCLKSVR